MKLSTVISKVVGTRSHIIESGKVDLCIFQMKK